MSETPKHSLNALWDAYDILKGQDGDKPRRNVQPRGRHTDAENNRNPSPRDR